MEAAYLEHQTAHMTSKANLEMISYPCQVGELTLPNGIAEMGGGRLGVLYHI